MKISTKRTRSPRLGTRPPTTMSVRCLSARAGAAAEFSFSGGAAWAALSGAGREPGLYEVDGRVVADDPGLRLHGVQFTPQAP